MRRPLSKVLLVMAFVISACSAPPPPEDTDTVQSASKPPVEMEQGTGDVMMDTATGTMEGDTKKEDAMEGDARENVDTATSQEAMSDEPRTVRVSVANWQFTPSTFMVKKGEKVSLELIGMSGVHGYAVPELGINVPLEAGQTKTVDLPTDRPGTYDVFCSIPCGSGHADMRGTIVVQGE